MERGETGGRKWKVVEEAGDSQCMKIVGEKMEAPFRLLGESPTW